MWPTALGVADLSQGLDHEPSLDAGRDRCHKHANRMGTHNLKVKIDGDSRYQKVAW